MIDTHTHYDHKRFNKTRNDLMDAIDNSDIEHVVNATLSQRSLFAMRDKLSQYPKVKFTVGKHPNFAANDDFNDNQQKEEIEQFVLGNRTVAIGETGIDTYHCKGSKQIDNQILWFEYFIELSQRVDKPLILHIRGKGADRKALKVLKLYKGNLLGVVHCFCGSYRLYKKYRRLGDFYFGIGGSITFAGKDYKKLRRAVKKIPLERIVLETDCPYLAPKGSEDKLNSSLNLPIVISKIAKIKNISEDTVADITYHNAKKLFNLQ